MGRDQFLQTKSLLIGNQSFKRSLDYQELQNAILYLVSGMIVTRRFVSF